MILTLELKITIKIAIMRRFGVSCVDLIHFIGGGSFCFRMALYEFAIAVTLCENCFGCSQYCRHPQYDN